MTNKDFDSSKLNTYLNSNEIKELDYLNSISEKANNSIRDRTEIGNLTLNEILKRWANTNMFVFKDLVNLFGNLDEYNNMINDENSSSIITALLKLIRDVSDIFIKDDRAIYFGITLIVMSILFYFIGITS
jgi:hypothetical protein